MADPQHLHPSDAPARAPANEWDPPQKGDRIADGDSDLTGVYLPAEDAPVPPAARVRWGTLALVAIGLVVVLLVGAALLG